MDPRLDLIRHYRWLRQYGLNDSHSGNISLRSGDDYWISPTGACADLDHYRELCAFAEEHDLDPGVAQSVELRGRDGAVNRIDRVGNEIDLDTGIGFFFLG